ncbi:efflux RND transporter permease subunit [Clostridium sp. Cult2]|uniref:efflux RND transporter permease subunit n=1 Tax=Clostridium sp. Cult2 TaxID=2079003 RepID=UPI001F02CD62|nr:efflux RND transporter permease subunit [Clostridium sp. Cult2]MCF6465017.1 acriflavin resistance protein [Clostridium sp. Cult2]
MLSKFSVKRPYTVVVAVIVVLILGAISFINLNTDLLPSIDLPYVVIMTNYPGASPEEIEMIVTKPIEQATATVNNIKNVSSISRENSSIVILEFNNDTNMDSATIEINGMLDLIKPAWDDYSISSPMLMRLNPDMLPVMISAVDVEDMDIVEISEMVREKIIPELESVNGVASVTGIGLLEEKIEILIDAEKIEDLNKKILNIVDSELSEAEDQLIKAKKEIEDGKSKLTSEEEKHSRSLVEGEKAITTAKEQISLAESKILAGKSELIRAEDELLKGLKEIDEKEEELKAAEEALLALGGNLGKEGKVKLEGIKQTLELLSEKRAEADKGLETVSNKMAEVEKEENLIKSKKSEIAIQEQELKTGRLQLTMEMDKAKAQLERGEETLNEKIEEFDKAKEEAFKKASLDGVITPDMISGILAAQNFSMPAGYVSSEEGIKYLVKVGDKIKDVNVMENLLLFDTGEDVIGKIYLKDVADISKKDNSKDIYSKVNGNDAVMLVFQKQSTFLTSDISKDIREKSRELSLEYEGLSFTDLMDQGMYIDIVVDSVLKNIVYGGLLAILVLILFLRDMKPTFIIAVSIPISIIFAIAMMYFTGVTINIISLAGLALGVGMLVDNSIVAIENIYRLRHEGKTAKEAAVEGAKEISGAIIASTLTTACVFLPIIFVKGLSRQLFADMGLTIAYSLFASLIVALTLVPTMASGMLKNTTGKDKPTYEKFINGYEKLLRSSLNHRGLVMILVTVLFVVSIFGGLSRGTSFIPEMDAPQMSMSIEMPDDATFKDTREMTDTVINRLLEIEEIETIGAFHSDAMSRLGGGTDRGSMSLYLLLDEEKNISNDEIKREIIELTEDLDCTINVSANTMDISAIVGSGIEVVIKGKEIDTLHDIASDMVKLLEETEGITQIDDGIEENLTEIRIAVDKEKAMEKGLTVAQVFSHINSMIGKDKTSTILSIENKDYPVIVLDKRHESITKDELEDLTINTKKNGEEIEVAIGDISAISEAQGLSSIRRDSQERFISVKADLDVDYNIGLVSREFEKKLNDYKAPDGYKIELAGEREIIDESLMDLAKMLLLAIVLIYLIMVAQFQSLLSPFIILFTIPLAFTGGLLALVITGNEISLIAMLGFLVLSGIVVNNGIVFVDYTNQLREKGFDKTEALVLAGKTRMRPILMTAITTIFGLSTLSAGIGTGAEMVQPLAIVSIGGLTYATILTLFVVPVMYHLLNKDKSDVGPMEIKG